MTEYKSAQIREQLLIIFLPCIEKQFSHTGVPQPSFQELGVPSCKFSKIPKENKVPGEVTVSVSFLPLIIWGQLLEERICSSLGANSFL